MKPEIEIGSHRRTREGVNWEVETDVHRAALRKQGVAGCGPGSELGAL